MHRKLLRMGAYGAVCSATDWKSQIVAIKIIPHNKITANTVASHIKTFEKLKGLANDPEAQGRLLRLREVIYARASAEHTSTAEVIEEVSFVWEPAAAANFTSLKRKEGM